MVEAIRRRRVAIARVAVVALLPGRHRGIYTAAFRFADAVRGVETTQVKLVGRSHRLTLCLEHGNFVNVPVLKATQVGRRRDWSCSGRGHSRYDGRWRASAAERQDALNGSVDASEIHRQVLVDEHPHVVVPYERQCVGLGRVVCEVVPHFGRETEIVLLAGGIRYPTRAVAVVGGDLRRAARVKRSHCIGREEQRVAVERKGALRVLRAR